MEWLSGKKTYLVAIAMVILAGLRHQGYITDETFVILEGMLTGAGLAALRAGVEKK
mgnify:CR=1 FL=1